MGDAADSLGFTHCPECGYDMRGKLDSDCCPECGEPFIMQVLCLHGISRKHLSKAIIGFVAIPILLWQVSTLWLRGLASPGDVVILTGCVAAIIVGAALDSCRWFRRRRSGIAYERVFLGPRGFLYRRGEKHHSRRNWAAVNQVKMIRLRSGHRLELFGHRDRDCLLRIDVALNHWQIAALRARLDDYVAAAREAGDA